jgi:hypothetical protein
MNKHLLYAVELVATLVFLAVLLDVATYFGDCDVISLSENKGGCAGNTYFETRFAFFYPALRVVWKGIVIFITASAFYCYLVLGVLTVCCLGHALMGAYRWGWKKVSSTILPTEGGEGVVDVVDEKV